MKFKVIVLKTIRNLILQEDFLWKTRVKVHRDLRRVFTTNNF